MKGLQLDYKFKYIHKQQHSVSNTTTSFLTGSTYQLYQGSLTANKYGAVWSGGIQMATAIS